MSFSTQLLTLMPSTVKISTRSSHNAYGEPTFSNTTTKYRCRWTQKPGFVRGPGGEEVAYTDVVWARSTGATSITVTDRVTLPDGSSPPVRAVETLRDEDGVHHRVIYMGE